MTKLVGILNVTPDSFSDGGEHFSPKAAVKAAERMVLAGASIIDIGAESTRPGATPINHEEEWARLEPVLPLLAERCRDHVQLSLDTRHWQTAERALDYGVAWINDVSGFADANMVGVLRDSDAGLVVMHSLSVPADKSVTLAAEVDVVQELLNFARARIVALEEVGISRDRIVFDPGLGFGKTTPQSWAVLEGMEELAAVGVPLYVGHSRKSFLGELDMDRDDATLLVSQYLMLECKVAYLRVHEVARHRHIQKLLEAMA